MNTRRTPVSIIKTPLAIPALAALSVAIGAAWPATRACAQHEHFFASRVVAYQPAPGQFVNNPAFNDPSRALGPPGGTGGGGGGGTATPDNTSVVTLGGFGGSIVLAFDAPVINHPRNPLGLDCIVFSNALYLAGDPQRRFAEPATIEIAQDTNNDGQPDGPWYLVPGSHLAARTSEPGDAFVRTPMQWSETDPLLPPTNPAWFPASAPSPMTTSAYALPAAVFAGPLLTNPNALTPMPEIEGVWGYADCTPTLRLGDLTGDNVVDDPAAREHLFYTTPDDPFSVGVSPGSGGGDAFDIAWAVDPTTGLGAGIESFTFIRIATAAPYSAGLFGEISTEVDAVARVLPALGPDWNNDGVVSPADFFAFLNDFFAGDADVTGDGFTTNADFFAFLNDLFAAL